jgi:hypothetical protein
MRDVATVTNYAAGVLADGGPARVVDTAVVGVPCSIVTDTSREGLEQNRLLGRTRYIARFPRHLPNGTIINLNPQTVLTINGVNYEVKSPPRFQQVLTSPYQEVDIEVKS